jgi:glycosyltransferase involved in cell wall biosynthesis
MLRIGFDAKRLFNNRTGLGNYSRILVKGLKEHFPENEYFLFSPRIRHDERTAYFLGDDFKRITAGPVPGPLWRSLAMKRSIARARLDIYHGLSNELPYDIQTTGVPAVVTIHDLIFRFFPEDYPWIDRRIYEAKSRCACAQARRIIADSQSTKKDLMDHYGVPGEKISVVYPARDDAFGTAVDEGEIERVRARYALPPAYLLYVGAVNGRKNLLSLVRAMRRIRETLSLPLVVVGEGGAYKRKVGAYVRKNRLEKHVLFAPPVASVDLPAVYQRARIAVFPSRYEGFGLPIVEALSSGVPVITTRASSLPEAAGPGAFYADPDEPASIAEGIVKILSSPDYARRLVDGGRRHARQFNAADISRQLMSIYREVTTS